MNNFKKEGFRKGGVGFGSKPKFGGGKFGGPGRGHDRGHGRDDRGGEKTEMFSATCSACHKTCEVPFRPSGEKPVYCRECFIEKGPNDNRVGKSFEKRSDFSREARPSRPSYREEVRAPRESGNDDLKRQIQSLEVKVNQILEILNSHPRHSAPVTEAKVKHLEVVDVETPKKERKPKADKTKVKVASKVATKKKVAKRTKK